MGYEMVIPKSRFGPLPSTTFEPLKDKINNTQNESRTWRNGQCGFVQENSN